MRALGGEPELEISFGTEQPQLKGLKARLPLPGREFADVIREDVIEKVRRRTTAHGHFTHVRNIEDARRVPHRRVLVHDGRVLHRHFPTAKFDKFAAVLLVRLVK